METWMPTIKKCNNWRIVQQWTAKGTTHQNGKDQNAPTAAAENQPVTVEHPT